MTTSKGSMTFERYRELLDAGPTLTKADVDWLESFRPRMTMALAVRWALLAWR